MDSMMNETTAFRNGNNCYFMNEKCQLVIHARWIGTARLNEFKKFVKFVDYILMESYDDHQKAYNMIHAALEEYKDLNRVYPKLLNWLRERSIKYGL